MASSCLVPKILALDNFTTNCGITDTTFPSITLTTIMNGTNSELVVTGCAAYDTVLDDSSCQVDLFPSNPVCIDGMYVGLGGRGIVAIRCSFQYF